MNALTLASAPEEAAAVEAIEAQHVCLAGELAGHVTMLLSADDRDPGAAQKITVPNHGLPPQLAHLAGTSLETGPQAHAYAELIKDHLPKVTSGLSYSEITEELHAVGNDDEKLSQLRQIVFMGESLRASLMSAYQAWHLTTLVTGLGTLLTGLGAALVATSWDVVPDARRP